jgi:23S rRNA (cytidine1920-2'-O)/16S rRNA (cytidine1409-2'-O)-methyltransferase
MLVDETDAVAVTGGAADYVSRGGLKLRAALRHFQFDSTGRIGLDIGASTGGFTEVLLAGGADRVYAVENGRGQLHPRLAADQRVISLEGVDSRRIDPTLVPEPIGLIVADVSFISLEKAMPAAMALAAPDCWLVALVKPQFEGQPGSIPRDGVVKDPASRQAAVDRVAAWIESLAGWRVLGTLASPIHGGDGNIEFLIGAAFDG